MDSRTSASLLCRACEGPRSNVRYIGTDNLLKHYRLCHGGLSYYTCGQLGCRKSFCNLTSMIRHVKSKHLTLLERTQNLYGSAGPSGSSNAASHPPSTGTDEEDAHEPMDESDSDDNDTVTVCLEDRDNDAATAGLTLQEDLERAAGRVLLGLRSTASLTGSAIERFQNGCTSMIQQLCKSIKANVSSKLLEKGLSDSDVTEVLSDLDTVGDPFKNLKSIDDQLEYFHREFGLVKPEEKYLDSRIDKRLDAATNSYVPAQVSETFQYVSIIKTLTSVLQNKRIRSFIYCRPSTSDDTLRSYADATHYKNHPFIQQHNGVVQILIFFDELEIANALGAKTIIHKLAAFFFQILNFPPEVSSKLANIYLLALAYADDLKKPGTMEKIMTPFIHELKRLSSDAGVEIVVDGETLILRAVLVALTADTPAAHDILGLLGVGARHFCRRCLASRQEVRMDANFIGEMRTLEQHEFHILEVERRPKFSSECGVKRSSPLTRVPYFDVTSCSIFDAFHDLLEGIAPLVMKLVIRQYVFNYKLFTPADLNHRIASFSYGLPDSRNKPSANFTKDMLASANGKLKQNGMQNWCLVRVLPFLIADWVPDDDRYMKHLFLLQDLMQIILSFELKHEDLERLEILIKKHNESFMELFVVNQAQEVLVEELVELEEDEEEDEDELVALEASQENETSRPHGRKLGKVYVTNKLHHLTHYPQMIATFGPAVRVWCAKFEGRLKIFRQHSAICCNFKNPPKTMAKMFQLSNLHPAVGEYLDFQKGSVKKVRECAHQKLLDEQGLPEETDVIYTNSATINGEEYRPGLFVSLPTAAFPASFAVITEVIVVIKEVFLVVKPWQNEILSRKFNAFRVSALNDDQLSIIKVGSLRNFRAMAPWTSFVNNDIYLSLRTALV